jgi:hypothetical protein
MQLSEFWRPFNNISVQHSIHVDHKYVHNFLKFRQLRNLNVVGIWDAIHYVTNFTQTSRPEEAASLQLLKTYPIFCEPYCILSWPQGQSIDPYTFPELLSPYRIIPLTWNYCWKFNQKTAISYQHCRYLKKRMANKSQLFQIRIYWLEKQED